MPLNSFGAAFQAAGFQWTAQLCQADTDGDGLTNGQELGDPCCLWSEGDTPSEYMHSWKPSHPGFKDDPKVVSSYVMPECLLTLPRQNGTVYGQFNPGEKEFMTEAFWDKFVIPAQKTTYTDFALNFPADAFAGSEMLHIVRAEAIVDVKRSLHHYVIRGCKHRFPDELHGKAIGRAEAMNCTETVGGWAPGKTIVRSAPSTGMAFGPKASFVAVVVNVHFDNQPLESGMVDSSGLRIFYTPTLRPHTLHPLPTLMVSRNTGIVVPPMAKRWFLTRRCKLSIRDAVSKAPAAMLVATVSNHAHLLGHEMYAELFPADGSTPIELGSEPIWHFDDQYSRSVLEWNVSLYSGDVVQTTCVMDSSRRSTPTMFHRETTDEMCWSQFAGWNNVTGGSLETSCDGPIWSGTLEDGEPVYGLHLRRPMASARNVWDGSNLLTGGAALRLDGVPITRGNCVDVQRLSRLCNQATSANGFATLLANNFTCDSDMRGLMGVLPGLSPNTAPVGLSAMLVGKTLVDVCCETVCATESLCRGNPRCPAPMASTTTPTPALVTTPTDGDIGPYALRVLICQPEPAYITYSRRVADVAKQPTASKASPSVKAVPAANGAVRICSRLLLGLLYLAA